MILRSSYIKRISSLGTFTLILLRIQSDESYVVLKYSAIC